MFRTIRNILRSNWTDLIPECSVAAGLWLLGQIVALLMCLGGEPTADFASIAVVIALFGSAFVMLVLACSRFYIEFQMLLKFPVTRRAALFGELAVTLVHGAVVELTIFLLGFVGTGLHLLLFPGQDFQSPLHLAPWYFWLFALLAPPVVAMFAMGVVNRFGRIAGWVLYFLFIGSMVMLADVVDLAYRIPPVQLAAIAVALLVALPLLGAYWLLRAAVNV